jgi:hypothetical protein
MLVDAFIAVIDLSTASASRRLMELTDTRDPAERLTLNAASSRTVAAIYPPHKDAPERAVLATPN